MNKGVEMYKRDDHYYSIISTEDLYRELNTNYKGESDLVQSLMSQAISEGLVATRHELGVANEELWSLNDWPEGEGFGTSDFYSFRKRIAETIASERKFLKAETELVAINKLQEAPKNDTVREYMKMNEKLAEGLVA
tara:strand:+ start:2208 stop:2618 length:411 start_codon:yes stop_codon:yes gene_type:complete